MMIEATNVHARGKVERGRPAVMLRNVSFVWGSGVLAIMGSPYDGVSTLLELLAGVAAPTAGRVLVEGRPPADVRNRIAYVPLEPSLPESMRVDEISDLAADVRREARIPVEQRLAVLGIEGLAKRRARTLDVSEVRSVLFAFALTCPAPVLLVEEPLAMLTPPAASRALEALRARAAAGASVVVTTSSVRDATRLGDRLAMLTGGVLGPVHAAMPHFTPDAVTRLVVVVAPEARTSPLVAALSEDPNVLSIESVARALIVTGRELVALAAAVTRAVATSGVEVEAIEPQVTSLDLLRRRPA